MDLGTGFWVPKIESFRPRFEARLKSQKKKKKKKSDKQIDLKSKQAERLKINSVSKQCVSPKHLANCGTDTRRFELVYSLFWFDLVNFLEVYIERLS